MFSDLHLHPLPDLDGFVQRQGIRLDEAQDLRPVFVVANLEDPGDRGPKTRFIGIASCDRVRSDAEQEVEIEDIAWLADIAAPQGIDLLRDRPSRKVVAERESSNRRGSGPSAGSWPRPPSGRSGPAARPVRTRRPARDRSRRERMPRAGQLRQVDGSRHRWFGPELPFATLVAGIDDATGRVPGGTFRAQEDAVGYFTAFAQTADHHGLPGAVYSEITHDVLPRRTNRPKHRLNTG